MARSLSRFAPVLICALFCLKAERSLAQPEDSVVVVGVGQIGTWFTELTGSNPGESPLVAQINFEPTFEPPGPCPALCPIVYLDLGPNGTHMPDPSRVGHFAAGDHVSTIYITPGQGTSLPSVRARVVNAVRPAQSISVPAFKLSSLLALNPVTLSFPGAKRSATARTNLVLADLRELGRTQGAGLSVQLDAFDGGGHRLSSAAFTLAPGETRFLVDVLGQLGVDALETGQVRVRKNGGNGHLWGTLFTTDADGTLAVSVGAHP